MKKFRAASILIIAATAVSNLSMVFFHRTMSSRLGDSYGRLMSLFALANLLGAVTMGVNTFLVKEFSRDAELAGSGAVKGRLASLRKPLAAALALGGLGLLALGPSVMAYLHLPSFAEYALVVLMFLSSLLLLVLRASVQGLHDFKALALSLSLEGVGRIAGAALGAGMGVIGGLLSMLGGQGLGYSAALGLKGLEPTRTPPPLPQGRDSLQARLGEISADTLTLLLFSAIVYMDIFVVKHNYPDAAASSYSRAALVAKSFLYLTSALNMVLLPAVAAAQAGGRDPRGLLLRFFGAALAINLAGLAFIWVFTDFVIGLLCGRNPEFLALAPLIRIFSLAAIVQALFQLLVYYLLAVRSRAGLGLVALLAPAYYALLSAFHSDPFSVVKSMALVSVLGVIGAMAAVQKTAATA